MKALIVDVNTEKLCLSSLLVFIFTLLVYKYNFNYYAIFSRKNVPCSSQFKL